jgi:hypothetical protein
MKLTLILLVSMQILASFSSTKKTKGITYVFYEYDSERLKTREEIKFFQLVHVHSSGYAELLTGDGKSFRLQIDKTLVDKIMLLSRNGLKAQVPITEHSKTTRYAGQYAYLSVKNEKICFNPNNIEEELRTVLTELDNQIKNQPRHQMDHFIILSDKLKNSIKSTHKQSNLSPIANPPPMMLSE